MKAGGGGGAAKATNNFYGRTGSDQRKCFNCGKVGHLRAKCRLPAQPMQQLQQQSNNGLAAMSAVEHDAHKAEDEDEENADVAWLIEEKVAASASSVRVDSPVVYFDVDSGCTRHLVNDLSLLTDVRDLPRPIAVSVANGATMNIHQVGTCRLQCQSGVYVTFGDVGYHPRLPSNLISVSRIVSRGGYIAFMRDRCEMRRSADGEVIQIVPKMRNLFRWRQYKLRPKEAPAHGGDVANWSQEPRERLGWSMDAQALLRQYAEECDASFAAAERDVVRGTQRQAAPTPAIIIDQPSDIHQGRVSGLNLPPAELWHRRFGHGVSLERVVKMSQADSVDGMGDKKIAAAGKSVDNARPALCDACAVGRSHRQPFHAHMPASVRATHVLERVHVDLCEVKLTKKYVNEQQELQVTLDGDVKYILVLIDEYTRMVFVYLLRRKSDAKNHIADWCRRSKAYHGREVQEIHADGGKEFINQEIEAMCKKNGTLLTFTQPYTPQHNGMAERMNRTLLEMARSMCAHARLPVTFIYRAICTAVYLHNRSIHAAHMKPVADEAGAVEVDPTENDDPPVASSPSPPDALSVASHVPTPYELWTGKKPNVKNLRVFGSDCYLHMAKQKRASKVDDRSHRAIFVGYHPDKYEWRVLDTVTSAVVSSRDVVFNEDAFTFRGALLKKAVGVSDAYDGDEEEELDEILANIEFESELAAAKNISAEEQKMKERNEEKQAVAEAEQKDEPRAAASASSIIHASPNRYAALSEADEHPVSAETDRVQRASRGPAAPTAVPVEATSGRPPRAAAAAAQARISSQATEDRRTTRGANSGRAKTKGGRGSVAFSVRDDVSVDAPSSIPDPVSYSEAMSRSDSGAWRTAMDKEMKSHALNGSWRLVEVARDDPLIQVIGSKWVYKLKRKADGSIDKYKARLVARGFNQRYGVDYFETYAAVLKYKTFRLLLLLVTCWDYDLKAYDVETAYLQSSISEDVYMQQPQGYEVKRTEAVNVDTDNIIVVCKLLKSVYGTKQAGRNWNIEINSFIVGTLKYRRCTTDTCLYVKWSRAGRIMMIGLFVDDLIVAHHHDDAEEWREDEGMLMQKYKMNGGSEASSILGMRIVRDRDAGTLTLDQSYAIRSLLAQHRMDQCTARDTPEQVGVSLIETSTPWKKDGDQVTASESDAQRTRTAVYQSVVGALNYLTMSTRPDISHAVNVLSRFNHAPTEEHMTAAHRVLRYLNGAMDMPLRYHRGGGSDSSIHESRRVSVAASPSVEIVAYCDADWAADRTDRKSTTGYVIQINGCTWHWASKKQGAVALSSAEAEYYALSAVMTEIKWLHSLLDELKIGRIGSDVLDASGNAATLIYCDNQAAIAMSGNDVHHDRTKHIDIRHHFVRGEVNAKVAIIKWISTKEQLADVFTKPLSLAAFTNMRKKMMK